MERLSGVLYASFYEAAQYLEGRQKLRYWEKVTTYMIKGEVINVPDEHKIVDAIFAGIKPQIDANNAKYEAGKKGGRRKKPVVSEKQENKKPMVSEKEKEKKPVVSEKQENKKPNVNDNVECIMYNVEGKGIMNNDNNAKEKTPDGGRRKISSGDEDGTSSEKKKKKTKSEEKLQKIWDLRQNLDKRFFENPEYPIAHGKKPPARSKEITPSLKTLWKKIDKDYTVEQIGHGISQYCTNIVHRKPQDEYYKHRRNLYDFLKNQYGLATYVNKNVPL